MYEIKDFNVGDDIYYFQDFGGKPYESDEDCICMLDLVKDRVANTTNTSILTESMQMIYLKDGESFGFDIAFKSEQEAKDHLTKVYNKIMGSNAIDVLE